LDQQQSICITNKKIKSSSSAAAVAVAITTSQQHPYKILSPIDWFPMKYN